MDRPVYRKVTKNCDRCRGSGSERASDEVILRNSEKLLRTIAGLKLDDPKSQEALAGAYDTITQFMIGNEKTWLLQTSRSRSIFAQKTIAESTALIARASVVSELPSSEGRPRLFVVRVSGTDQVVLLSSPVTAESVRSGKVLVGGLFAGFTDTREARRAIVLQNGFLIAPPVQPTWYWWNRD
jgi:hypothetical protein